MIQVPIQYATWWRMTEGCSGVRGDLSTVKWYTMSEPLIVDGQSYAAYWWRDDNRIVLSLDQAFNGRTVRHEMLHALMQSGAHPTEYFVTRCGAIAPCDLACNMREADRAVPETARRIASESLNVRVSFSPAGAPSRSIDSGWVTVMITATNNRPEPVWVTIPGLGPQGPGLSNDASHQPP